MSLHLHDCDRFRAKDMLCPFQDLEEDDDDPDTESEDLPLAIPARKQREMMVDNLSQFPVIAHGDPRMKKALERMAAIQHGGGLPSIPREVPNLPFQGRGHPELISILAAIAIMSALKGMRSITSSPSFQAVRVSESRVAKGLTRLGQSGRPGSRGGFGGIHTQAPRFRGAHGLRKVSQEQDNQLKRLLGFSLGPPGAGFDEFSETGF